MPVIIQSGVSDQARKTSLALWRNIFTEGTFTSANDLADYPGINAIDPATYNTWRATAADTTSITVTFPTNRDARAMGIAAHNMGTSACSVEVLYSINGGATWLPAADPYSPLTDEDFIIMFPQVVGNAFRVRVFGGQCNVGVVFVGPALQFPHPPVDDYKPLHHARSFTKLYSRSMTGHLLSNRVIGAGAETEVDFGFVERDFVDSGMTLFERHYNRGGTFFFASWPGGKPQDMGYCWAPDEDSIIDVRYIEGERLASLNFGVSSYVGA